uniref:FIG002571: 4-hydroxybenzoyl-CoA thioesterase domain protein n=1 Tax=uncultured bacterium contig00031 TaxID=1181520 RepID=A0A806KIX1_9BACT|nr:FIG002571: 4-hydroxybenzoyl-CoA thioesterase domain protein [uncultured bacterium contig00031]
MGIKSTGDNGPFNIFAETQIPVEFYHLDPFWVVWHGNYLKFFEAGRRALLEKIGYGYLEIEKSGFVFPIVNISVKYMEPLRIQDQIRVRAILVEYETCLKVKYEVYNSKTGRLIAKGKSTQMAYDINKGESRFACPRILIDKIEAIIGRQSQ